MLGQLILGLLVFVCWLVLATWSAVWMNTGLDFAAQVFLNKLAVQNLTVRLFTNNYTPVVTSVPGSFTECALTGYAAVALAPSDWSGSTVAGLSTYTHPAVTFTFSAYAGGTTIYGYYCTIPGLTAVLADTFTTPYAVPAGGGTLTVTPTYQDQKF